MPSHRGVVYAFFTILLSSAAPAQVVLYQDTFPGDSADPLGGTTPQTTIGANSWTAPAGWQADGSFSTQSTAYLPFTPVNGNIYSIMADFDVTSSTLMMFIGAAGTNIFGMNNAAAIRLDNGTALYRFPSPAGEDWSSSAGTVTSGGTAEIRLNAVEPTWTVSFFYNETSYGTFDYTPSEAPTAVGFGAGLFGPGVGTISNFSVSIVPEPYAYSLASGCGLLLLTFRRRASHS